MRRPTTPTSGLLRSNRTQDRTIATRTTSEYRSISLTISNISAPRTTRGSYRSIQDSVPGSFVAFPVGLYRGNRKLSPVPTNTSSVGPHSLLPTETSN